MDKTDNNPLDESLVYEDLLPLSWFPRSDEDNRTNYQRVAEHNEHVLRCVNLLGEQVRDKIDEESETDSAIVRLEAKVNLLLELVSKLDQRTNNIPNSADVRLGAAGIEWLCSDANPTAGSIVWIKLYLDNRIPEPMELPAIILTVTEQANGSKVCARFDGLGEVVQDQMEKMIFRHHRRMVAQSRSS